MLLPGLEEGTISQFDASILKPSTGTNDVAFGWQCYIDVLENSLLPDITLQDQRQRH